MSILICVMKSCLDQKKIRIKFLEMAKFLVANYTEFKFIQCKIRALMFRLGEKLIFQRDDGRLLT